MVISESGRYHPYFLFLFVWEARRKLCAQSSKVNDRVDWVNLYYNPISIIRVMLWTASARYYLIFFFFSHCYIHVYLDNM